MSDAFDPYYQWLAISPKDQPPNHYRLLGLDLYESNPDVIRDAAERQMAHVRTYQLGRNAPASQRILNELGAARACLLHPAKKAEYDEQLRRQTPAAADGLLRPASPPPIPPAGQRPGAAFSRMIGVWMQHWSVAGRPLLLIGLVLVLAARGCEDLGRRAVKRAKAVDELARAGFEDVWKANREPVEGKLEEVRESLRKINAKSESDRSDEDRRRLEDLGKQETTLSESLSALTVDEQTEKVSLERGPWRDLRIAARDAPGRNDAAAYRTELVFLAGTILLATGLSITSWTAHGAERWVCLLMLAILATSIYIVGAIWPRP